MRRPRIEVVVGYSASVGTVRAICFLVVIPMISVIEVRTAV